MQLEPEGPMGCGGVLRAMRENKKHQKTETFLVLPHLKEGIPYNL